jgi:hypothetical protein
LLDIQRLHSPRRSPHRPNHSAVQIPHVWQFDGSVPLTAPNKYWCIINMRITVEKLLINLRFGEFMVILGLAYCWVYHMKRPIILPFSEQVTNIPQYEYINHFGMIPPNDNCEVVVRLYLSIASPCWTDCPLVN